MSTCTSYSSRTVAPRFGDNLRNFYAVKYLTTNFLYVTLLNTMFATSTIMLAYTYIMEKGNFAWLPVRIPTGHTCSRLLSNYFCCPTSARKSTHLRHEVQKTQLFFAKTPLKSVSNALLRKIVKTACSVQ